MAAGVLAGLDGQLGSDLRDGGVVVAQGASVDQGVVVDDGRAAAVVAAGGGGLLALEDPQVAGVVEWFTDR